VSDDYVKAETPRQVHLMRVIHTVAGRGDGVKDRFRLVDQFWAVTGELLAENDPFVSNHFVADSVFQ
jgi:hypothetical protein